MVGVALQKAISGCQFKESNVLSRHDSTGVLIIIIPKFVADKNMLENSVVGSKSIG